MSNADIRGRFVWHELMTTDPNAAGGFYSKVVPWKTQPSGMPSYTLWMSGTARAGGLMAIPDGEAAGTPPHWLVYVATPDVDATAAAVQRLGGRVLKAPADIPNVGRFAVLADPQGAAFAGFTPAPGSDQGGSAGGAVGDFTWHELATTDPDAAVRFYSELFGWGKGAAHDMGAMGVYQLISHGGKDVGGIYKARDASTPPSWLSYVRVADAGKAASAVKAGGGRVLHGPIEVPGGSWIVMALDPQGGAFAVVEAPRPAAAVAPKPAAAPKPATAPKPAAAPKPAVPASSAPPAAAKPAAPAAKPAAPAAKSAAPKAAAGKKKAKKKAAKSAARKAGKKAGAAKSAARKKKPAAKRAARKGSSARRGTSGKKSSAKRGKTSKARAKGRKHR